LESKKIQNSNFLHWFWNWLLFRLKFKQSRDCV